MRYDKCLGVAFLCSLMTTIDFVAKGVMNKHGKPPISFDGVTRLPPQQKKDDT